MLCVCSYTTWGLMGLLVCRNFLKVVVLPLLDFLLSTYFSVLSLSFSLCVLFLYGILSLSSPNSIGIQSKRIESNRIESTLVTKHTPSLSLSLSLSLSVSLRNGSICYLPHAMPPALPSLSLVVRYPISATTNSRHESSDEDAQDGQSE